MDICVLRLSASFFRRSRASWASFRLSWILLRVVFKKRVPSFTSSPTFHLHFGNSSIVLNIYPLPSPRGSTTPANRFSTWNLPPRRVLILVTYATSPQKPLESPINFFIVNTSHRHQLLQQEWISPPDDTNLFFFMRYTPTDKSMVFQYLCNYNRYISSTSVICIYPVYNNRSSPKRKSILSLQCNFHNLFTLF